MVFKIDRRGFIAGSGICLLGGMQRTANATTGFSADLFASAVKFQGGGYGVVTLDHNGNILSTIELPGRGHEVVIARRAQHLVAFARRPGNFAIAFSTKRKHEPVLISAKTNRHFYGHGVFSKNNRLLFAAENKISTGDGKIGIYDVVNNFAHIGEFDSYGIGPHEIALVPGTNILAVCNGGIKTHPSSGKAGLNLNEMKPSVVFIDVDSGDLIEKHELGADFFQLSIRHMAIHRSGEVVFGCQHQNPNNEVFPLVGSCHLGQEIKLWNIDEQQLRKMKNYVGSVAISNSGEEIALSSPRGGVVTVLSMRDQKILKNISVKKVCGLAPTNENFIGSTLTGEFGPMGGKSVNYPNLHFDNHITKLGND